MDKCNDLLWIITCCNVWNKGNHIKIAPKFSIYRFDVLSNVIVHSKNTLEIYEPISTNSLEQAS